ncbi:unnamed protein product [Toxocara canis]|uniref:RanBD1 domain-containing protein n=1 Tax=Toxocara canis TaxID=6265 RepID=A0A183TVQ8_TOXCA|nr:unnamed protein product [Toxocara canis]
MPEPERTSLPSSNGDVGMSDQKANTGAIINEKSVPQQRDECRSLKNVEGEGDEDDPNRHLAKVDIPRDVRNRVKLYVLCDQRIWDDKGTGHVACVSSPEHQGATFIVVRLEHNGKFSHFLRLVETAKIFTGFQRRTFSNREF